MPRPSRPVDPLRLCPKGAIIYPQRLTFTDEVEQARKLPSTNKRTAACSGEQRGGNLVQCRIGLHAKRPRHINGEAQIEIARQARRLGSLAVLPNELILNVIQVLEDNAFNLHYQRVQDFGLVCLALTSSDFYKICKAVHPAPLPTTRGDGIRDEKRNFWAWSLERHIGDFLGPKYEVRELDHRYGFFTRNGSPFMLKDAKTIIISDFWMD